MTARYKRVTIVLLSGYSRYQFWGKNRILDGYGLLLAGSNTIDSFKLRHEHT